MKGRKNKKLDAARYMPPLHHSVPGEEFNIKNSQAIMWLLKSPDILNYLWDHVRQSANIVYDPDTCTWKGVDYHDD